MDIQQIVIIACLLAAVVYLIFYIARKRYKAEGCRSCPAMPQQLAKVKDKKKSNQPESLPANHRNNN